MGFGLLTFGYILLYMCRGADIFPDTIAYVLIFLALRKTAGHSRYFAAAKYSSLALLPMGITTDIVQITAAFSSWQPGIVMTVVSTVNALMLLVFHILLFIAIKKQADELELRKLSYAALRNLWITAVYYALTVLIGFEPPFLDTFMRYFGIFYIILGLVWLVLNAVLLYGCYMRICLEGEEDMPERSGFFGRLNNAAEIALPKKESKESKEAKSLEKREGGKRKNASKKRKE